MNVDSEQAAIPQHTPRVLDWLDQNWLFAGTIAMLFLVALVPLLVGAWPTALIAIYLLLVIYQLHQIEEHYQDRFRRFVNDRVMREANALTPRAVMWINVTLVWVLYVLALWLAAFVDVGMGLIAVYMTLVNGLVHVAMAIGLRCPNPGLWTSIVLFIPVGSWAWMVVNAGNGLGAIAHGIGLTVAIGGHVLILATVRMRINRLKKGL